MNETCYREESHYLYAKTIEEMWQPCYKANLAKTELVIARTYCCSWRRTPLELTHPLSLRCYHLEYSFSFLPLFSKLAGAYSTTTHSLSHFSFHPLLTAVQSSNPTTQTAPNTSVTPPPTSSRASLSWPSTSSSPPLSTLTAVPTCVRCLQYWTNHVIVNSLHRHFPVALSTPYFTIIANIQSHLLIVDYASPLMA